jgi:hypothetical protein
MSGYGSLLLHSLNPLCSRVRPCECGCIHETEALFPIARLLDSTFQRMDGALADAWPYFPVI